MSKSAWNYFVISLVFFFVCSSHENYMYVTQEIYGLLHTFTWQILASFKVTNVLDLSFPRNHGNLLNRITSRKKFLDLRFLCLYKLFRQKLSSRYFGYPVVFRSSVALSRETLFQCEGRKKHGRTYSLFVLRIVLKH